MPRLSTVIALLLTALGLGYALWVEPRWVEVTQHDLRQSGADDPIRIVQLSDLHLQTMGALEASVATKVREIGPDFVILSRDVIDRADTLPILPERSRPLAKRSPHPPRHARPALGSNCRSHARAKRDARRHIAGRQTAW